MKYNTRKWNPLLISIPDFGIGAFWGASGTFAPWIIYNYTNSHFKAMLILSLGSFTGLFMQIISGKLSDQNWLGLKGGKRTPWIIGGVTVAACSIVCWAKVPNYNCLFVVALITYAAVNFYQGPYYTLIMEVVDRDQIGHANSLARTSAQIGVTFLSWGCAVFYTNFTQLETCIIMALLLFLPTILVLPTIVREKKLTHSKLIVTHTKEPEYLKKQFGFLRFCVIVFFIFISYSCLIPMLTPFIGEHAQLGKYHIGMALTIYGLSSITYGFFAGKINDLFGHKKVLLLYTLNATLLFVFGFFVHHSVIGIYVFMGFAGIIFLSIVTSIYTLLPDLVPKSRLGEFQGYLNFSISLSQFISTPLLGIFLDLGFAHYLYLIGAVGMLIAFIITLIQPKANVQVTS